MKSRVALLVLLLSLNSLVAATAAAKKRSAMATPLRSNGEGPNFFVDYTNLQGVDSQTYVEFYIQLSYQELQFIKAGKGFSASYEIEFTAYDDDGNVVGNQTLRDSFQVDTYAQTQATEKSRVALMAFTFEPGWYRVKVLARDMETEKTSLLEEFFQARSFQDQKLAVSDIQFSQRIEPAKSNQPYVKNNRYIEPNAVRTFAQGLSDVHIYFEVYNLSFTSDDQSSTYTSSFIFQDSEGKKIAQFQRHVKKPGATSAHSLKIPISYFTGGLYTLTVRVKDEDSGQIAESSKNFTVIDQNWSLNDRSRNTLDY
ncbi:MAG: hypothetical protein ACE5HO_07910 [bacterium]